MAKAAEDAAAAAQSRIAAASRHQRPPAVQSPLPQRSKPPQPAPLKFGDSAVDPMGGGGGGGGALPLPKQEKHKKDKKSKKKKSKHSSDSGGETAVKPAPPPLGVQREAVSRRRPQLLWVEKGF